MTRPAVLELEQAAYKARQRVIDLKSDLEEHERLRRHEEDRITYLKNQIVQMEEWAEDCDSAAGELRDET